MVEVVAMVVTVVMVLLAVMVHLAVMEVCTNSFASFVMVNNLVDPLGEDLMDAIDAG
jgi:hypothetical protein